MASMHWDGKPVGRRNSFPMSSGAPMKVGFESRMGSRKLFLEPWRCAWKLPGVIPRGPHPVGWTRNGHSDQKPLLCGVVSKRTSGAFFCAVDTGSHYDGQNDLLQ
ncbi:hypothetical protein CEXT_205971 [Caerostris extrusa]|uniref:Uncharacterized protein n=1 Tax=Caerostris extrusa TaxID=172846 RepID=A0AAV4TUT3_CAEEX|nr:hypothetical protein CEXT_205971 [Caerostris extrusa]